MSTDLTSNQLLVERLRARLVAVPKPGTLPRLLYPGEVIHSTICGPSPQAGDDAGLCQLHHMTVYARGAVTHGVVHVQPHYYVIEPLSGEAADEIERLTAELRLAESARDYANAMLDKCRTAEAERDRLRAELAQFVEVGQWEVIEAVPDTGNFGPTRSANIYSDDLEHGTKLYAKPVTPEPSVLGEGK